MGIGVCGRKSQLCPQAPLVWAGTSHKSLRLPAVPLGHRSCTVKKKHMPLPI